MALHGDEFAITSIGNYPEPTPTALQRAAFAVSYGLLQVVGSADTTGVSGGLKVYGYEYDA